VGGLRTVGPSTVRVPGGVMPQKPPGIPITQAARVPFSLALSAETSHRILEAVVCVPETGVTSGERRSCAPASGTMSRAPNCRAAEAAASLPHRKSEHCMTLAPSIHGGAFCSKGVNARPPWRDLVVVDEAALHGWTGLGRRRRSVAGAAELILAVAFYLVAVWLHR
jgi:hypothetical protein